MSNIIYISGKISGLSKADYINNFLQAEKRLSGRNAIVVNPIKFKHPFKFWLGYIIYDLIQLRKCTHIALMPNWIDSKGAVVEFFFSKWIFKQQIIWLN